MTNKDNTGNCNTGDCNTGNCNTGDCNTGDCNTGNCNTGNYNTGNCNTGYRNTGYHNTGYRNTGDCNTGDCNTGNYNTGYRNTGNYNTGYRNTGYFNTDSPKVRIFNQECDLDFDNDLFSEINQIIYDNIKPVCTWIYTKDMTDEEKEENETYKTTGGYLKQQDYKYCWKKGWEKMTNEEKEKIKSLPNFCPDIFEEITGIRINEEKKKVTLELTDEQLEKIKGILEEAKEVGDEK